MKYQGCDTFRFYVTTIHRTTGLKAASPTTARWGWKPRANGRCGRPFAGIPASPMKLSRLIPHLPSRDNLFTARQTIACRDVLSRLIFSAFVTAWALRCSFGFSRMPWGLRRARQWVTAEARSIWSGSAWWKFSIPCISADAVDVDCVAGGFAAAARLFLGDPRLDENFGACMRAEFLKLRNRDLVEAAEGAGVGAFRVSSATSCPMVCRP